MCRLQLRMTINSCTKRSVIYSLSVLQPYYFFVYCECAHFCNVNKSLFNDSIWECLCCQDAKWIYSEYLEIHLVSEIFWHRTILDLIIWKGSSFNIRLSLFITNKAFSFFTQSHFVPIPYDLLSSIKYKKRYFEEGTSWSFPWIGTWALKF